MNGFAYRLQQAMDNQGINQTTLAEKTKIGASSISQYLSGKNEPAETRIHTLASVLEVSAEWLAKGECPNEEIYNLPVERAAKLMGIGVQALREGLKIGAFSFGSAIKMPSGKYRYYISPIKFTECTGVKV